MKQPKIWTEDIVVRLHELDAGGHLSILSICNYLQSAASNHARALGISLDDLKSTGHTWVLAQLKIRMDRYPSVNAPIRIHTWPAGIERLYALREFRIVDETGRVIGAAGSSWMILNLDRRRPVRVEPFGGSIHQISEKGDFSPGAVKLQTVDAPEHTKDFHVRYHDMDVNQHVNNVSYVEWALESLPAALLTTASVRKLEVLFRGEARLGDTVVSQAQPMNSTGSSFIHHIFCKASGDSLFKAQSSWSGRAETRAGLTW